MASLRTSVEHLIRNIDEFVLARVRRYRGKSTTGRYRFVKRRMRSTSRPTRCVQSTSALPETSLIFAFHCLRISATTGSGREM